MRGVRLFMIAALLGPTAACARPSAGDAAAPRATGGGGGMTFQQFAARRERRLMAMDTNGDGRISRAEFIAGRKSGHGDPARRFRKLDANGDGFLDRAEIDAMLRRRFQRMDADGDGTVSPAERAAAHGGDARPGGEG